MIVKDLASNGSAPTAANIFQNPSDTHSPINRDYTHRFKVMYDKFLTVNTVSLNIQVDKAYRKCRNSRVNYLAGSTTPASGGLWLVALSDSGNVPNPGIIGQCRVGYSDS